MDREDGGDRIDLAGLPARRAAGRLVFDLWSERDLTDVVDALVESVGHLDPWIPWATREPPSPDEVRELLAGWVAQTAQGANRMYALRSVDDGRLVGGIGAYDRVGGGWLEVGYWVRRGAVGHGYATEASRALEEWIRELGSVRGLVLRISPENVPSRRIPEKLGYTLRPAVDGPVLVYERPFDRATRGEA